MTDATPEADLFATMRTTFSCRSFTDEAVTDDEIDLVLDHARFASSGGNRQPWRVVVARDPDTLAALRLASEPALRVYSAQREAGEAPWNTVHPTVVDVDERWSADEPLGAYGAFIERAPVVLVIGVDLSLVASMDRRLDRIGIVSGASIYPFVWNLLLAANGLGLAGSLTTMAAACEPDVQALVGFPDEIAVAAVVPLGRPRRRLTRLSRNPVDDFRRRERWDR